MRRSIAAALTALAGLVVLVDLAIANPALSGLAGWLNQLLVLLAAGAGVAGALMLVVRHVGRLARREDQLGSVAVLLGIGLVLLPGLAPGSTGADAPAVRWVVASLLAPLIAAGHSAVARRPNRHPRACARRPAGHRLLHPGDRPERERVGRRRRARPRGRGHRAAERRPGPGRYRRGSGHVSGDPLRDPSGTR